MDAVRARLNIDSPAVAQQLQHFVWDERVIAYISKRGGRCLANSPPPSISSSSRDTCGTQVGAHPQQVRASEVASLRRLCQVVATDWDNLHYRRTLLQQLQLTLTVTR